MGTSKYFAYLMIVAGIILEFLTFQVCNKAECYFFSNCGGQLSAECLAALFVSSLLLIVGGAYLLKKQRDNRYV
jgi:hypothetical protein